MTEKIEGRRRGRPATGQTPVMSFRPPTALRQEFEQLAKAEGRKYSDALTEAMHDWVKKRHTHALKPPKPKPGPAEPDGP